MPVDSFIHDTAALHVIPMSPKWRGDVKDFLLPLLSQEPLSCASKTHPSCPQDDLSTDRASGEFNLGSSSAPAQRKKKVVTNGVTFVLFHCHGFPFLFFFLFSSDSMVSH